jgi:hypothetical protein
MDEIITIYRWNPDTQSEQLITTSLQNVIEHPSGFRMDTLGVYLLNKERKALGLSQYKFNPETGTFDEAL